MIEDIEVEDLELEDLNSDNDVMINEPHIEVDSGKLDNFLQVAKNIASESGRDIVSKSICMKVEGDKLKLYTTDFDVFLEYEIDLKNTKNKLRDTVIVPVEVISKLMKATMNEVVIYKSGEDEYKMSLIGGDMSLETYEDDENNFIYNGDLDRDKEVESKDLYEVIDKFSNLATSAVSAKERRIIFEDKEAYASYMWAIIRAESSFTDMDVKIKDIKVLKKLLSGREEELMIYDSEGSKVDRKVIEGSNFKYIFLVSDLGISQSKKDTINDVVIDDGIYLDYDYLNKIIEISAELPYSIGKVNINYSDNKGLKIEILTKTDKDSEFVIPGTEAGNVKQLDEDLVIHSDFFKALLKSFSGYSSIKISLTEDGIGFYTDKYQAVLSSSV